VQSHIAAAAEMIERQRALGAQSQRDVLIARIGSSSNRTRDRNGLSPSDAMVASTVTAQPNGY